MVDPRDREPRPTTARDGYVYRRTLAGKELIPAIGAGIVTGIAAYYVAKLFLERTPLLPEERRLGRQLPAGRATG
jgi:hypothetical protein